MTSSLRNRAVRKVYPSPDTYYQLNVEASTGPTIYQYPDNGMGKATTTESEAIWNDLGLTDGTFFVRIVAVDILGAGTSQVFIMGLTGTSASDDTISYGITPATVQHVEPMVDYDDGFRASFLLTAATSPTRISFQIVEVADPVNLAP